MEILFTVEASTFFAIPPHSTNVLYGVCVFIFSAHIREGWAFFSLVFMRRSHTTPARNTPLEAKFACQTCIKVVLAEFLAALKSTCLTYELSQNEYDSDSLKVYYFVYRSPLIISPTQLFLCMDHNNVTHTWTAQVSLLRTAVDRVPLEKANFMITFSATSESIHLLSTNLDFSLFHPLFFFYFSFLYSLFFFTL